ncbi:S8 family peptidase [Pseudotenacibaculum haliotis]|uniref:S8 family peptidase n=1 Tax=Pseudotenacibaculum haliotis TaxID=1862138 RepID=A0ABW5LS29_9FLAO
MRIMRAALYTLGVAMFVTGCKSAITTIPVPAGSEVAIIATGKKAPLTEEEKKSWGHADLAKDSIPGMSVGKAYDFLRGKKGTQVIVAVVDSGTDLEHEDLKDVAWVNEDEIPNNGKDDDNNGFIDDINGWNFLGKIYKENAELYRVVKDSTIADAKTYKRAKKAYDKKVAEATTNKQRYGQILQAVTFANTNIIKKLNKKEYKKEDLKSIDASDPEMARSVAIANQMFDLGLSSLQEAIDELTSLVKNADDLLSGDALKINYRTELNDDENSMTTKVYGDNKSGHSVKKESHGTHVSGIVGATRSNGKGMNGVASNVKIMAVRVVPDGDEYDKDVALGIRYAVDNGAKVINTSFGKGYSPKVQWVYDAIKYAEEKDVLIVNAAGNDSKDIDTQVTYPNDTPDMVNEISDNFLTIGAISSNYNENLPASFTNYGKINVDIFAPGVQIYSTTPEDEYAFKGGTSMASPGVAGIAALIRSYYPQLSASQVKRIIMNSGTKLDIEVIKPGSASRENPDGVKVPFAELSVTGRIANAYNALKMADAIVNGK